MEIFYLLKPTDVQYGRFFVEVFEFERVVFAPSLKRFTLYERDAELRLNPRTIEVAESEL